MKKITPAGIGLDLAGDAIEGSIAGAGSAIGGIAKGLGSAIGGVAEGAGKALGGALEGALREPDVYINSYGMAGAYAKENIKTTVRIDTKKPVAVRVTEDMPLEKLMTVAIKYLSSISKNLRDQIAAENKIAERERLSQRENIIEQNQQDVTPITQENKGKKNMSNMTKALLAGGALGLVLPNIDLNLESLGELEQNIKQFQKDYGWLIETAGWVSLGVGIFGLKNFAKGLAFATRMSAKGIAWTTTELVAVAGGAIPLASAIAFGGAAVLPALALMSIDSDMKSGAKKALTVKDHLKKYGIEVKTSRSGGMAINSYWKDGKKLSENSQEFKMAVEYGDAVAGIRNASSIKDLDKKYSDKLVKHDMKTGDIKAGVYQAFINAGFSPQGALSLSAEVGRENSFNPDLIFGSHIDPHNAKSNAGIFSYQGSRRKALLDYLAAAGVFSNGQIEKSQRSLDAMAKFARMEMDKRGHTVNGMPLSQFLSQANVNQEDAARAIGKDYIQWRYNDPKYASGHKNRKQSYTAVANAVGQSGNYEYSSGATTGVSGAVNSASEMIQASLAQAVDIIKTIGKTDTQFRPLTAKTPTWDKARKIVEDQAKMDATMALGKKEEKQKQDSMINIPQANSLRNINGGSLDVIDPNYKSKGKDSILNNYILNFSSKAA